MFLSGIIIRIPRRQTFLAAGWWLSVIAIPAVVTADVVDLRDGVRTTFYGGRYTGSPAVGDFLGWSMAVGDVDGDGHQDFLVSAANSEGPNDVNDHQCDVYLFFGRPRAEADSLYAVDEPGGADIVFYRGGWSMACGDIDRDGYDDVILCETLGQSGAYIIFGGPRSMLRPIYNFDPASLDYTPADVYITGASKLGGNWFPATGSGAYISHALVAGDFNGDGYCDLVIGNTTYGGPSGGRVVGGAVHIVFGRPRGEMPSVIDVRPTTTLPHPDVTIYGENGDRYPTNLASGDVDGDGIADLIASTYKGWGTENSAPGSGEVHIFWGRRNWASHYDTQIGDFDLSLNGRFAQGFGYRVSAGDLDGDGRDDIVVGTPGAAFDDIDRRNMGAYRVFFGRPRGDWPHFADATDLTDVLLIGSDTDEVYPGPNNWLVSLSLTTGHCDDDKYDDLLIGAGLGKRPGGETTGRAYLVRGRPRSAWPPFIDLRDGYDTTIFGVDGAGSPGYQFDLLGACVGVGDWDGDGLDEMFLSAMFADGPANFSQDVGEVYVVYSSDSLATQAKTPHAIARSELFPNYPNPFNPSTTFHYNAPIGSAVRISVYDVRGREVARPFETQWNTATHGLVAWTAVDRYGSPLPSGVYFVKLQSDTEVHARKIHLVR